MIGERSVAPRILVTGAGGFVGPWLLKALRARLPFDARLIAGGYAESAAVTGQPADGWDWIKLDVTDPDVVAAAVTGLAPTCVVHLAAVAAPQEARRDPNRAWLVNLQGALNVARAVLRHAPAARFLFASTAEVYGGTFKARAGALDEDALLDPVTPYGACKAAADLAIGQMAHEGLKAIRFRLFNHTGPGQSEQFVVPAFAAQIARIERGEQEPLLRVGNLDVQRDFLDVRDVVDAYVRAVLRDNEFEPGLVLNVASGVPRRIGDVLDALLARARCPIRVAGNTDRMRPNDLPLAAGDAARARRLLGWAPAIPWESTLADILEDWRARATEMQGSCDRPIVISSCEASERDGAMLHG